MNIPETITEEFLKDNPNCIFVFGDNLLRKGYGGAAKLRDCINSYGFITKKYPNNFNSSFYTKEEYLSVFEEEKEKLIYLIENNPDKIFLVSKLGGGLANKFHIYEDIIKPWIDTLSYDNIVIL